MFWTFPLSLEKILECLDNISRKRRPIRLKMCSVRKFVKYIQMERFKGGKICRYLYFDFMVKSCPNDKSAQSNMYKEDCM